MGQDGKTSFARLKGKPFNGDFLPFASLIMIETITLSMYIGGTNPLLDARCAAQLFREIPANKLELFQSMTS